MPWGQLCPERWEREAARASLPKEHGKGVRAFKSAAQHVGLCWVVMEGAVLGALTEALPYRLSLVCRPSYANGKCRREQTA